MKRAVITLLAAGLCGTLQAQINVGGMVRDKINQRAQQRTEQAVDKSLDEVEKGAKKKPSSSASGKDNSSAQTPSAPESDKAGAATAASAPAAAPGSLKSFSRFDFVPGESVIFFEDFAADNIADFPARWNTNGSGEVVTTNSLPGKWLKMQTGSYYAPDLKRKLPENYTIEYDLVMSANDDKGHIGDFYTSILSTERLDNLGYPGDASVRHGFHYYSDNTSSFGISNSSGSVSNSVDDAIEKGKAGQKIHVSIAVNKQRFRLWYEDKKMFDLPRLMPEGHPYNQLLLQPYSFDESQPYTVLISNLRIAEGTSDIRSKLLTEGKLVTRGITFDSGSDKIRPESYGTLKEIAKVLTENDALKVRIVGHTDSDGADATNLELSKKRAAAIKGALEKEFSVAANRMETDGKGETMPASPNTSAEGKANNRRVEFVKI